MSMPTKPSNAHAPALCLHGNHTLLLAQLPEGDA